jgi:hypothetical protein
MMLAVSAAVLLLRRGKRSNDDAGNVTAAQALTIVHRAIDACRDASISITVLDRGGNIRLQVRATAPPHAISNCPGARPIRRAPSAPPARNGPSAPRPGDLTVSGPE